mmetsp:Transcript_23090/g.58323  ORF Transcript_23090/g.58323 Transcript_23090/m.58323 type:complete len:161 (-) Transcript_23090:349-831(-)
MNCVTAVLVEKVMHTVREDKDVHFANQMCELFIDAEESITFEEFRMKLNTKTMRDFFETINVETSAARSVFDLVDIDDSGRVDTAEMISGFLKLRGPAKALEVMMIMRAVRDVHVAVASLQHNPAFRVARPREGSPGHARVHEAADGDLESLPPYPADLD